VEGKAKKGCVHVKELRGGNSCPPIMVTVLYCVSSFFARMVADLLLDEEDNREQQ
jgi:hypothetical protein